MFFYVSLALIWALFLALLPMAFFWLRRAWRIFSKHDYSEVALKGGQPPAHPEKWAKWVGLLNLGCGLIAVWVLVGVPLWIATGFKIGPFHSYDSWSAIAGSTIWLKIFADFIISRQAHPIIWGKKKKP